MKNKLIKRALIFLLPVVVACQRPSVPDTQLEVPNNNGRGDVWNPEVDFIMQYAGQLFDGDVRKAIEGRVGTLTIDSNESVINEYWIAKDGTNRFYVKIKAPEYTIIDAYAQRLE